MTFPKKLVLISFLLLIGTGACVQQKYTPVFEPAECRFEQSVPYEVECGDLVVPEDRANPEGNQVRMHVAIYRSRSDYPEPDPVVYLTGGGGGNEMDRAEHYLSNGNDAILDERDFIMYSQRGTKYNTPYLECDGYSELIKGLVFEHKTQHEIDAQRVEFFDECRERFLAQDINLDLYNTTVNAADLNDLRIALGYDQINIYGTSYGTRLALYTLKDYGQHIRSAIIDSVYPPQIHYYSTFATNAHNTFQKMFEACESEPTCKERYPDLENAFYRVVDELNATPRFAEFGDSGETIRYDGSNFVLAMYLLPYRSLTNYFPVLVGQASMGDYEELENLIPYTIDIGTDDIIADAAHNSIQCREETPFDSYERLVELGDDLPEQIAAVYDFSYMFDLCEGWGVEAADIAEKDPVSSDVPTLILTGEFDPITPPEWGRLAGETLRRHYYYEFPGHGHGVMRSVPCGFQIGLQFLIDPYTEPDTSCMNEMPEFRFE